MVSVLGLVFRVCVVSSVISGCICLLFVVMRFFLMMVMNFMFECSILCIWVLKVVLGIVSLVRGRLGMFGEKMLVMWVSIGSVGFMRVG